MTSVGKHGWWHSGLGCTPSIGNILDLNPAFYLCCNPPPPSPSFLSLLTAHQLGQQCGVMTRETILQKLEDPAFSPHGSRHLPCWCALQQTTESLLDQGVLFCHCPCALTSLWREGKRKENLHPRINKLSQKYMGLKLAYYLCCRCHPL